MVGDLRKHFRPEFFNRIDHVVPFASLTRQDILAVVGLERDARPLRRVIEERIMGPLSVLLAADRKLRDVRVHVVVEGGGAQRQLEGSGAVVVVL